MRFNHAAMRSSAQTASQFKVNQNTYRYELATFCCATLSFQLYITNIPSYVICHQDKLHFDHYNYIT